MAVGAREAQGACRARRPGVLRCGTAAMRSRRCCPALRRPDWLRARQWACAGVGAAGKSLTARAPLRLQAAGIGVRVHAAFVMVHCVRRSTRSWRPTCTSSPNAKCGYNRTSPLAAARCALQRPHPASPQLRPPPPQKRAPPQRHRRRDLACQPAASAPQPEGGREACLGIGWAPRGSRTSVRHHVSDGSVRARCKLLSQVMPPAGCTTARLQCRIWLQDSLSAVPPWAAQQPARMTASGCSAGVAYSRSPWTLQCSSLACSQALADRPPTTAVRQALQRCAQPGTAAVRAARHYSGARSQALARSPCTAMAASSSNAHAGSSTPQGWRLCDPTQMHWAVATHWQQRPTAAPHHLHLHLQPIEPGLRQAVAVPAPRTCRRSPLSPACGRL